MDTADDFTTENLTVKATERYLFGWNDPRVSLGSVLYPLPIGGVEWDALYRAALYQAAAKEGA